MAGILMDRLVECRAAEMRVEHLREVKNGERRGTAGRRARSRRSLVRCHRRCRGVQWSIKTKETACMCSCTEGRSVLRV